MIYRFETSKKKIVIQGLDSETALIKPSLIVYPKKKNKV